MAEHVPAHPQCAPPAQHTHMPPADPKFMIWDWQLPDGTSRLLYVDRLSAKKATGPWHAALDAIMWKAQVLPEGIVSGEKAMSSSWQAAVLGYEAAPSFKSEITLFLLAPLHGCEDNGWTFNPIGPKMTSWIENMKDGALQSMNTSWRPSYLRPSRWTPCATFMDITLKEVFDGEIYKQKTIQDLRQMAQSLLDSPHQGAASKEDRPATPTGSHRLDASVKVPRLLGPAPPGHSMRVDSPLPALPGTPSPIVVSPTQPMPKADPQAPRHSPGGPQQGQLLRPCPKGGVVHMETPPTKPPGQGKNISAHATSCTQPQVNPAVRQAFHDAKAFPGPSVGGKGNGKAIIQVPPPECAWKGSDTSLVAWTGSGKGLAPSVIALADKAETPPIFHQVPDEDVILMSQMSVAGELTNGQ